MYLQITVPNMPDYGKLKLLRCLGMASRQFHFSFSSRVRFLNERGRGSNKILRFVGRAEMEDESERRREGVKFISITECRLAAPR